MFRDLFMSRLVLLSPHDSTEAGAISTSVIGWNSPLFMGAILTAEGRPIQLGSLSDIKLLSALRLLRNLSRLLIKGKKHRRFNGEILGALPTRTESARRALVLSRNFSKNSIYYLTAISN